MNMFSLKIRLFATTIIVSSLSLATSSVAAGVDAAKTSSFAQFEPLIEVGPDGKKASPFLKEMQDTLLRMNDLSYNQVKGTDKYLEFADQEFTKLEKEGWNIYSFRGLEGRRSNFIDLSGIVSYHAEKNVVAVVYHGTASNKEGWETNFDATKLDSQDLLTELRIDLYQEMVSKLQEASFSPGIKDIRKFLKSMKPKEFDETNMLEMKDRIDQLSEKGTIELILGEYLTAPIRLKLELIEYVKESGVTLKGQVHSGFAKKYFSTKKEVLSIIKKIVDSLSPEKRKSLKIIFSGHSQAGGTGSLALTDITANHSQELFGPDFDNRISGTFYGYLLSAARVGDSEYVRWMHEHVGQDYIARQNVKGDPVPIAAGDSEMANLLRENIPAIGKLLAQLADFDDAGHLLLDDGHEAWERARALYEQNNISVDELDALSDTLYSVASMFMSPDSIPAYIASKENMCSWNPVTKVRNCKNVIGLADKIWGVLKSDKQAIAELSTLFEKRYGHLHYGHYNVSVGSAIFSPSVVGRDLDAMLDYGHAHEEERLARRKESKRLQKQDSRLNLMMKLFSQTIPLLVR